MSRTVVAMMEDHPGVMNRVVSVLRRRGFNINSLSVGPTDNPGISRMTIVVDGDETIVEQVIKQLYKIIEVLKCSDISNEKKVDRELALIKVAATASTRSEVMQLVSIYRAKIVDVSVDSLMVEVTGPPEKIETMQSLLRAYGIREMVRTGVVAMTRSTVGSARLSGEAASDGRQRGNLRAVAPASN